MWPHRDEADRSDAPDPRLAEDDEAVRLRLLEERVAELSRRLDERRWYHDSQWWSVLLAFVAVVVSLYSPVWNPLFFSKDHPQLVFTEFGASLYVTGHRKAVAMTATILDSSPKTVYLESITGELQTEFGSTNADIDLCPSGTRSAAQGVSILPGQTRTFSTQASLSSLLNIDDLGPRFRHNLAPIQKEFPSVTLSAALENGYEAAITTDVVPIFNTPITANVCGQDRERFGELHNGGGPFANFTGYVDRRG